ncbi:unnamed protein product [Eruca vesicaria subsp. sativa]|uniref:long-chain-alcohol O-fatty-acyltransferase n=1 Tax=Eruca vesicaria subsp. sativa TaxID=29727 RepID=A0ABC8J7S5_ERUVS|nr:unnamed protein product [Eruca vesicaria subsp. sativa]
MEEEIKRLVLVYISAIISVSYCYYIPSKIKAGTPRLLSILPVCVQLFVFPMLFSSPLLIFTIMFTLTGMGTFKLILFAFDKGPLFPLPTSLFRFMCFTLFPIERLRKNPKFQSTSPTWVFSTKVAICAMMLMLHMRGYKHNLPTIMLWVLYPLYFYLSLEISLNTIKFLLTIILGCDLEPVFDEPYLATSLQDFWGRRWNPMVSSLLRSAIYAPLVGKSKSDLAMFIGGFTTFVISGLIHELLFFHTSGYEMPSGEITLFYVLHGFCTAIEMVVKRSTFGQRRAVRPVVSRLLTMTFMIVTSGWLYFPQILRGKLK